MSLDNEGFFVGCSGVIPSFLSYQQTKSYHTCEYCHSDVEMQAVRCSSCGAPKNSYKVGQSPKLKERNYHE